MACPAMPVVTLEFGGRATGEPHQVFEVACDVAAQLAKVFTKATKQPPVAA